MAPTTTTAIARMNQMKAPTQASYRSVALPGRRAGALRAVPAPAPLGAVFVRSFGGYLFCASSLAL
jgi:hypothetical protein